MATIITINRPVFPDILPARRERNNETKSDFIEKIQDKFTFIL
ncbi:hypothetical protein O53_760 [Microcystis aeruginosa TAIHU98]|uniref:Uncharacterized protein n=1 Tax=Microcystis aeruginosa TAIHU98 TaxID=1134457 RepID=L7E9N5_MICAE|nr:hypothetical protein O53_760 [Microcystis aeruginosa TAIHU98]